MEGCAPGHPRLTSWKIPELPFWGKATGVGGLLAEGLGWARVPPAHSSWRGILDEEDKTVLKEALPTLALLFCR